MSWFKREVNEEMMKQYPDGTPVSVRDYPTPGEVTEMTVNWHAWLKPLPHLLPVSKHNEHYMCVPLDRIM